MGSPWEDVNIIPVSHDWLEKLSPRRPRWVWKIMHWSGWNKNLEIFLGQTHYYSWFSKLKRTVTPQKSLKMIRVSLCSWTVDSSFETDSIRSGWKLSPSPFIIFDAIARVCAYWAGYWGKGKSTEIRHRIICEMFSQLLLSAPDFTIHRSHRWKDVSSAVAIYSTIREPLFASPYPWRSPVREMYSQIAFAFLVARVLSQQMVETIYRHIHYILF